MSFVVTIPEALAAVATDLAGIGSTIGTANAAPRSRPRGVGRRRR
ncbi:PE-PGRS family protein [Mycobacterium tuberculosis CAS/NITR204]|uniref:PE-PGRS family protein n=1 Tax=Mycobacterium tuberculosis CAS/NITR204 TaxID=1310114 RepID=R4M6F8_MYCTX|nr:PE-PGRS family protein [Mycobacterium tuberculosis CAS/NITR204]